MSRHIPQAPLAIAVLLAGCSSSGAPAQPLVPIEPQAFACRLDGARPASGAEQRITVRADDQHTGLLLRAGSRSGWRALAAVAGSSGQVYADTAYAWRANGTAGVLTDIRNVQTYSCTAVATAAGAAE
jgi:membrane-bound inhibitor of C-type lysozyme